MIELLLKRNTFFIPRSLTQPNSKHHQILQLDILSRADVSVKTMQNIANDE